MTDFSWRSVAGASKRLCSAAGLAALGVTLTQVQPAVAGPEDPAPPAITNFVVSAGSQAVQWTPYPAVDQYLLWRADQIGLPFFLETNGAMSGFGWTGPSLGNIGFLELEAVPMSANDLLSATALNRLAYGPTPGDLERLKAIGPDAYIEEQLTPENIDDNLDIDRPGASASDGWQYVTATGYPSSSTLLISLMLPGEGDIDDISLVAGTRPGVGKNLVRDGGFETGLPPSAWTISPNMSGSSLSTNAAHSGAASLHLVAALGGSAKSASISQVILASLSPSQPYTLSYWYLPSASDPSSLIVEVSGGGLVSSPDSLMARLASGAASIDDLRAWHGMHAVRSQRQLLEVAVQFFENHFVTQYSKSASYFGAFYPDNDLRVRLATNLEYRQLARWRAALLAPDCTFYDLLKISAESPAMIIYLDTVNSKGNGANIANENYARELMELFTMGVDNGYDQSDITVMSRAWTGWSLELVDPTNVFNPFARRTTRLRPGVTTYVNAITNLSGVWAFNYKAANHNNGAKTIFPKKRVPARFGPPWAGRRYELDLPARSGAQGIEDGYDVIGHLANQPMTEEFISVKLCRVFVHDDFAIGYDFTDPNLSPEGKLVQRCMLAWENSNPKGQIRAVLRTIFNSDLFRGAGAAGQKIKTPFEFVASAIRALRAPNGGGYTADSDGYSFIVPMHRMGGMDLFDREEPDGYPEAGPPWISAGTLNERARFIQTTLMSPSDPNRNDGIGLNGRNGNVTDPVALIHSKLPPSDWTNAGAIADYFLSALFPGEGKANLDLYRTGAIRFLNTSDNGGARSPFASLSRSGNPSPYETRLRGMIGMLMTSPRFQEQ